MSNSIENSRTAVDPVDTALATLRLSLKPLVSIPAQRVPNAASDLGELRSVQI